MGIVIGIAVAHYFYRKTVHSKILAYAFTTPVPVSWVYDAGISPDATVNQVRLFLLLWNKGVAPIEVNDFVRPIQIVGPKNRCTLYNKDGAADVSLNDNKINVALLRPGEAAMIMIHSTDPTYQGEVDIQMKSPDMSALLRSNPVTLRAGIAALFTVIPPFIILLANIYLRIGAIETSEVTLVTVGTRIGVIALLGASMLFMGAVGYWLANLLLFKSVSSVTAEFSSLS